MDVDGSKSDALQEWHQFRFSLGKRLIPWQPYGVSTITISVPDEDLAFLRAYSQHHGTSPEALLARQMRALREHLEQPLHPDVVAASGLVSPLADGLQEHKDHLEKKYG